MGALTIRVVFRRFLNTVIIPKAPDLHPKPEIAGTQPPRCRTGVKTDSWSILVGGGAVEVKGLGFRGLGV